MFAEVDTDKRNVLHDDLPERKTPCQHTAHRVGVTISLNPGLIGRGIDNFITANAQI
ncbi:Uncharacterised protein [Yersinia enterocolitica]|nr:hypothetical protein YE105_C2322 [Yersinia enterocolitica subsp. palearctica 105.5R(r)]AJJ28295.1 hypothetical protein CH48_3973 [Yersinia enterocolitica]KGA65750.1 hypothetical protein DJ61_2661 [Yersinia enterocolitica]CFV39726.1 Uncharacterised protein [Yersinia enterocolitica]CNC82908.1 Uncharacterised protein [Yersinia enterocolitica]